MAGTMKKKVNRRTKIKLAFVIASLLTIGPIFVVPVHADPHGPNNIVFTPYGTCTQEFYYEIGKGSSVTIGGITINQLNPVNVIKYQFTKPTDGTFDLAVTPYTGVLDVQWYIYTTNCYLVSVTQNGRLRFAVEDQENCEIAIVTTQYTNRLILTLENQQLTQSDSTNQAVNEICTYVEGINDYVFNMQADTGTIKNILLNSLGAYVTNDGSVYTDMQALKTALTTINTTISKLNSVNWTTMNVNITYSDTLNGTYATTLPNNNLRTVYARVEAPTNYDVNYMGDFINKISFGLRSSYSSTPYYYVYLDEIYNYNLQPMNNILLYYENYSLGNTVYLNKNVFGNSANSRYIYFKFSTSGGYFRINDQTFYGYIDSNNVRYWELLDYFKQNTYHDDYINKLSDVISAINNMSMNVNNLTVNATGITYNTNQTDVTNSVTNYNTNINQVFNIENNLSTDFNTYNQQFNPDFTDALTSIQTAPDVMNGIMVSMYDLPLFHS